MSAKKGLNLTLKIWRQKNNKTKGQFESYKLSDVSTDSSFLEMLDILNEQLINNGQDPVAFDHDCREGICGMCSLYINGREVVNLYANPAMLWVICPVLLYWVSRVWLLAHRGEMHDDPVVFALRDTQSYLLGALVALMLLMAV